MRGRETREIVLTVTPGTGLLAGVMHDGEHERPFVGLLGLAGALEQAMRDDAPETTAGEES